MTPVGAASEVGSRGLALSHVRTFLRSFLIQGSWNYQRMIGGGFAYALVPVLEKVYKDDPEGLGAALARHSELFNAHPYLSGVALGAAARLEEAGSAPDTVQRFKVAVRGPLGSLGDSLVWAAVLPVTSLLALLLAVSGAPPEVVLPVFLAIYNVVHLRIRVWGFRAGLRDGSAVGQDIRSAELEQRASGIKGAGAVLLGILVGALLVRGVGTGPGSVPWLVLAVPGFVLGAWFGNRIRKAGAVALMIAIAALVVLGATT